MFKSHSFTADTKHAMQKADDVVELSNLGMEVLIQSPITNISNLGMEVPIQGPMTDSPNLGMGVQIQSPITNSCKDAGKTTPKATVDETDNLTHEENEMALSLDLAPSEHVSSIPMDLSCLQGESCSPGTVDTPVRNEEDESGPGESINSESVQSTNSQSDSTYYVDHGGTTDHTEKIPQECIKDFPYKHLKALTDLSSIPEHEITRILFENTENSRYRPLQSLTDGNCLYSSFSILFTGGNRLTERLRENCSQYLYEFTPYLCTTKFLSKVYGWPLQQGDVDTIISECIGDNNDNEYCGSDNTATIRNIAHRVRRNGLFACILEIICLGQLLNVNILVLDPYGPESLISGRLMCGTPEAETVVVSWTQTGELDTSSTNWQPNYMDCNHFVPCVPTGPHDSSTDFDTRQRKKLVSSEGHNLLTECVSVESSVSPAEKYLQAAHNADGTCNPSFSLDEVAVTQSLQKTAKQSVKSKSDIVDRQPELPSIRDEIQLFDYQPGESAGACGDQLQTLDDILQTQHSLEDNELLQTAECAPSQATSHLDSSVQSTDGCVVKLVNAESVAEPTDYCEDDLSLDPTPSETSREVFVHSQTAHQDVDSATSQILFQQVGDENVPVEEYTNNNSKIAFESDDGTTDEIDGEEETTHVRAQVDVKLKRVPYIFMFFGLIISLTLEIPQDIWLQIIEPSCCYAAYFYCSQQVSHFGLLSSGKSSHIESALPIYVTTQAFCFYFEGHLFLRKFTKKEKDKYDGNIESLKLLAILDSLEMLNDISLFASSLRVRNKILLRFYNENRCGCNKQDSLCRRILGWFSNNIVDLNIKDGEWKDKMVENALNNGELFWGRSMVMYSIAAVPEFSGSIGGMLYAGQFTPEEILKCNGDGTELNLMAVLKNLKGLNCWVTGRRVILKVNDQSVVKIINAYKRDHEISQELFNWCQVNNIKLIPVYVEISSTAFKSFYKHLPDPEKFLTGLVVGDGNLEGVYHFNCKVEDVKLSDDIQQEIVEVRRHRNKLCSKHLKFNSSTMRLPIESVLLASDATPRASGGHCGSHLFSEGFTEEEIKKYSKSSSVKFELFGVFRLLNKFRGLLSGKRVVVGCDSKAAIRCINTGKGEGDSDCDDLVHNIHRLRREERFEIRAEYFDETKIAPADALSRIPPLLSLQVVNMKKARQFVGILFDYPFPLSEIRRVLNIQTISNREELVECLLRKHNTV